MIIISASGMCEGGRILHHLRNGISNPLNIILITGFQAENTLGRRIVDQSPTVKIFGEEHELRATVFTINGLSGHADRKGLCDYAATLGNVEKAFCVHGETEYCQAHATSLRKLGIPNVHIPVQGQLFRNV
jgi:metallo-beta-lactamase family protein